MCFVYFAINFSYIPIKLLMFVSKNIEVSKIVQYLFPLILRQFLQPGALKNKVAKNKGVTN